MDIAAGVLVLLLAFSVKPIVMVVCGWLLTKVYGSTYGSPPKRPWLLLPDRHRPEMRLLFWSLVLFAISELTCGVEIYVIFHSSPWTAGTHAVTSAAALALFAVGAWDHLDKSVLRYGESACALNRICQGCTIAEPAGCKLRTIAMMAATFVALAAVPPLFAGVERMSADPSRWLALAPPLQRFYDHVIRPATASNGSGIAYFIPRIANVIEFRIEPVLAACLGLAGVVLIRMRRERDGMRVALAGAGVLVYVYLEVVTLKVSGDALAAGVMHEIAEFWFLVITAEYLSRAFGRKSMVRS